MKAVIGALAMRSGVGIQSGALSTIIVFSQSRPQIGMPAYRPYA
jgi:hypothetical protein